MSKVESQLKIMLIGTLSFCEELILELIENCEVESEGHHHAQQLADVKEMQTLLLNPEEVKIVTD